ncbi:monovalent cation/H(+) antiporter subunit G [Propylenella binzhouense]|uniref:Monovalent cation/H(+) antiporter subunit G n=1 Tax=Propylenella binzhouense TaxID=2555902 RepID=A0A964T4M4_9HYPH|nr:monovalent cation/H(+) antiporter subunit G [Propylenella binzhouense]MYZ48373.1 monovalent cation/H(+) antiporter subunit G [Propylenella binzhouense]
MIADILAVLSGLLVVIGALFALVGAIGVLRLPDLYTRMHAASKAGTIGSGIILLALAVEAMQVGVITRALAGIVFLLLTAPVSAHLLARAAVTAGLRPWPGTTLDEVTRRQASRITD